MEQQPQNHPPAQCGLPHHSFSSGICAISSGVVVSLLQEEYGFAYGMTGTLLSLLSIGNLLAGLLAGALVGKMGMKPSVLLLTIGYAVGYGLMGLTGLPILLALAFFIVGIAKGSVLNTCTILVSGNSADRTRGMNTMHACYACGALLCPFLISAAARVSTTLAVLALAALGLEYKEGLAEAERGTAGETSRNIVRQFYGEDCDANAIIDSLHRVADEEFQKPVPKKPGLDELLAWLDANHIPMAVASSSRVHVIEGNLNNWGLTHYFKALVVRPSRSNIPSPTRRSSCWRRKSWAPTPPHAGAGGQLQRCPRPVPPAALSPSWCPICSPRR